VDATLITIAELSEEVATFTVLAVRHDDGEEVHLTILHLFHCRDLDALVLRSRVEDDENRRHARVDFRVGKQIVGNTGRCEALAVQVGELFHFETAFLSNSFCEALAEEHDTFCCFQAPCRLLRELNAALQCLLHVRGQVSELIDVPCPDALRLVVALHL